MIVIRIGERTRQQQKALGEPRLDAGRVQAGVDIDEIAASVDQSRNDDNGQQTINHYPRKPIRQHVANHAVFEQQQQKDDAGAIHNECAPGCSDGCIAEDLIDAGHLRPRLEHGQEADEVKHHLALHQPPDCRDIFREQTEQDAGQRIEHRPDDSRRCAVVDGQCVCLEFCLDFLIHGKISFFAAGHGEMSSLQHLGFSGCCGNATRKGEQRAARNPPFRYKNSGTRHFWQAPLGLIRILHPNHITWSSRCHRNPSVSIGDYYTESHAV